MHNLSKIELFKQSVLGIKIMRENILVSFCFSCEKQKQNKNKIESKYLQNIKTNLIYVEENC
jgi:hypothetical protein